MAFSVLLVVSIFSITKVTIVQPANDDFLATELNLISHDLDLFSHMKGNKIDYESVLRSHILSRVEKDVQNQPTPPMKDKNSTIELVFVLYISNVIAVDEKTETVTINGFVNLYWKDFRLAWNAEDYGGLNVIFLPEDSIWRPLFFIDNSASISELWKNFFPTPIRLDSSGRLIWFPSFTIDVICEMDFHHFPYDKHHCFIDLGHWIPSASYNINISDVYLPQGQGLIITEWELFHTTLEPLRRDPTFGDRSLRAYFDIRRRAPYCLLLLIIPSIITMLITLVVFWIPLDFSSLKFKISSLNILLLICLVCHSYWVIPRSGSSVPGILVYTGNTLALCGVYHFLLILMCYLSNRKSPPVPSILQNLLDGRLGVFLCLKSQPVMVEVDAEEQNSQNISIIKSDWMTVAVAIDRILFIIFSIAFFVILTVAFV